MDDDADLPFHDFDDDDELVKRAEVICQHKKEKRFKDWMAIAFARVNLEESAQEEGEDPFGARDVSYATVRAQLVKRYPCLFAYRADVYKVLFWITENASQLSTWHEKLPEKTRAALSSPTTIRSHYEKSIV